MCGAGSAGVGVSTVIKDVCSCRSHRRARSRFYVEKEGLWRSKHGPADYDALAPEQQIRPSPSTSRRRPAAIPCSRSSSTPGRPCSSARRRWPAFTEEVVRHFMRAAAGNRSSCPCRTPPKCDVRQRRRAWTKPGCVLPVGIPSTLWNTGQKVLPPMQQHVRVPRVGLRCFVAEVVTDAMLARRPRLGEP